MTETAQNDKESSTVESISLTNFNQDETSDDMYGYAEHTTRLFDSGTPFMKEEKFRLNLIKTEGCSSTPKYFSHASLHETAQKFSNGRPASASQKSVDAVELWSVESKPIALAVSQESSAGDFHHVEAVLPKSRRCLSEKLLNSNQDLEEDEVSDGSHSHTVFTIAKLVSHLNVEKKKNKELEERIHSLESKTSMTTMQLELEKVKCEEKGTGQLACLVKEIYEAQKERESAMLARLKLATQERDEAILRAKAYAKDARSSSLHDENNNFHDFEDKQLKELISQVCEAKSGRAVDKYRNGILNYIMKLRQERDRITKEEMAVVIRERDHALYKCRLLTEEVNALKEGCDDQLTEMRLMRAKLLSAHEERDNAFQKLSVVEDEMETLRIYYSLYKSLVENGKFAVEQAEHDDASRLSEVLRVTNEHNQILEANANRNEAEVKILTEKSERLERLVNILRKKLNVHAQKPCGAVYDAYSSMKSQGSSPRT